MVSVNALHQLHIFIFFLAVFHVLYSAVTMTLGRLKVIKESDSSQCSPLPELSTILRNGCEFSQCRFADGKSGSGRQWLILSSWMVWRCTLVIPNVESVISPDWKHKAHVHLHSCGFCPIESSKSSIFGAAWWRVFHAFPDPSRFRLTHETSFVREHSHLGNKTPCLFYVVSDLCSIFPSLC